MLSYVVYNIAEKDVFTYNNKVYEWAYISRIVDMTPGYKYLKLDAVLLISTRVKTNIIKSLLIS